MRAISALGQERRYSTRQQVAWLLTLEAGDWEWHGATQAVTVAGVAYPAGLAKVEQWRETLPADQRPGGLVQAQAEVRILDRRAQGDASLSGRLAVTPPIGIQATLRLAWLGEEALMLADTAVMLSGRVAQWQVEPQGVRLGLVDELQASGPRRIGRILQSRMIDGEDSPSLGELLPWIFGRWEEAKLLPLRAGVAGALARALTATDSVVPLTALTGFATHGTVQIGTELIEYTALDTTNLTLGSAAQPVTRGAGAGAWAKGTTVRQVPRQGFQWVAADHPCRTVSAVRADGTALAATAWKTAVLALGEYSAQIVTMSRWPLGEDGKEAETLTATVEGWADEDGTLIENPADVIEFLLTSERLAWLAASQLDAASFSAVRATLAARGFRFARRLSGVETLGDLLGGAAREGCLWVTAGDPLGLRPATPTPHAAAAKETLDARRMLEAKKPATVSAPEGFIPPDAIELVGAARSAQAGRPTVQFPPESLQNGAAPLRFTTDWLDLTQSKAAGDLGELTWAALGEPPFTYKQAYPLGAALLGAGDVVTVTNGTLDLDEAQAWVKAVQAGPDGRAWLTLRGPWAGDYCWKLDEQNHLRRYAFGEHLVVMVGGAPVARLSRNGTLRLAGRMREQASLGTAAFAAPLVVTAEGLYCCVPDGAHYTAFMRITPAGDAELTGTVRERSTRVIVPGGLSLGTAAGRFWLSPDGLIGALEYDAADGRLHLREILIESILL